MKPGPKPLYLSLTFWSGILVMLFTGWAWWMSLVVGSIYFGSHTEFQNSMGYIGVAWNAEPTPPGVYVIDRKAMKLHRELYRIHPMPPPAFIRGQGEPGTITIPVGHPGPRGQKPFLHSIWYENRTKAWRGSYQLLMPHWLLMLAVAVIWGGMLLWRARRMRRAAKDPLTAP